jgi:hypothetical protein
VTYIDLITRELVVFRPQWAIRQYTLFVAFKASIERLIYSLVQFSAIYNKGLQIPFHPCQKNPNPGCFAQPSTVEWMFEKSQLTY